MFSLTCLADDDPGYIDQVQRIFAGCLIEYRPAEFYVIRIRNWFDYKWCYFTGKVVGAAGVSRFRDLTLPPFVPNRVLSQDHHDRIGTDGLEYARSDARPLHIRQPSEANFRRLIRRTTNDGTMLWCSSGNMATGRGSMMVYHVSPEIKFGWHVTFLKKSDWQIDKVSFTSKSLIERLRETGAVGREAVV